MAWSDRPDLSTRAARAGLVLTALTGALYLYALDRYPAVIGGDEVHFAIHAESIARSGSDLNGTFLPVFVNITDPVVPNHSSTIWYQPLLFYAMAPFISLFGVNEWAARLPVALTALCNIWLVYAIGLRLFRHRGLAVAGALLLALAPAHLIVSRQALDYVAPLPFVLGWLLCLLTYLDTGSIRSLAIGAALLGAGVFSYIAAWLLMPFLLALTLVIVWRAGGDGRARALITTAVAFGIPVLLLVAAVAMNPGMLANTLSRYSVGAANARPGPGLIERITLYWDYFNPSFLFFAGGTNPTQATSRIGVFPLALAPLILLGLAEVWRERSTRAWLVLVVFLASPMPVAATMPPAAAYSVARVMTLVPFGVLLAVFGLRALWRQPWPRAFAVALLATIPAQSVLFARDYLGDYQRRAATRLDPAHIGAVANAVIDHDRSASPPAIYLSHALDDGGARWRFHLLKANRRDLLERTRQIQLSAESSVEAGALVVSYAGDREALALIGRGYRVLAEVKGVAGEVAALILKAPG